MNEIFGLDMDVVMAGALFAFLLILVGVGVLALLNRIIFKVGVRNIPRRPAQTALIVVGLMLSTLIISSALGTGDTISYSIRNEALRGLGEIDELLVSNQGPSLGGAGGRTYFAASEFDELRAALDGYEDVDGLAPIIAERAPVINPDTRQSAGTVNIAAVDPVHAQEFGPLLTSGSEQEVLVAQLQGDEIFLSSDAADELQAQPGATLDMFLRDGPVTLRVREVVQQGGLAGQDSTVVMPLARAQEIFGHPSEINSILVSNRGDAEDGAALSETVTERLRSVLTDDAVADELIAFLNQPAILAEIREQAADAGDALRRDLNDAATLLENPSQDRPRLISLLADDSVAAEIMIAVEEAQGAEAAFGAFTLFNTMKALTVHDVKAQILEISDLASSGITSIFVIFGLFSIMAGVMLIFLIFVMLAAERRPEMGIARAVGMRRKHLVQSFIYEGLAYDLLSALVGALLGILVGFALVTIMAGLFASGGDDDFQLVRRYTPRSFIIAYSLGVVLTFITVFFSAYRASRLNIVSAIRNLQEEFMASQREPRLRRIVRALIRPFIFLRRSWRALVRGRFGAALGNLALALLWVLPYGIPWAADIVIALARAVLPSMSQGWPNFVFGVALIDILPLELIAIIICLGVDGNRREG
ncbi:MAG: ABC transporter permease, partial [Chloroflexi bacterium]|nr:ABC transporter permease [Chloroflexota bacterium]